MKAIRLENSAKVALVDDHHYPWLSQYAWRELKSSSTLTTYAVRESRTADGRKTTIIMHRDILGLDLGDPREVDHQDGNGLNNLESNLRVVTPLQNAANRPVQQRSRTGHKGVNPHGLHRYEAFVNMNGTPTFLGYFTDVLEAAFCYNTAAAHLHGQYARLNTIPPNHIPPTRQAELRQQVLDRLARKAGKPLTPRSPTVVYWDASRGRWRVRVILGGRWVHVGSYPLKAEADHAAALALDPNTIPDPAIKETRLEFIRKRIAYLQAAHQPDPEPVGT